MIALVFDTETTGLFKPEHRIIEISARVCNLATFREDKEYLWRFDPQRNIDAKALAVHGIPLEELKGKPLIGTVLPEFVQLIKDSDVVISHNGVHFDEPFIRMECERNEIECPEFYHFDTMLKGNFATDLGKSPSLRELAWCLDVDYDLTLAHKGDYDTAVLRDCVFNGVKRGWFNIQKEEE